MTQLTLDEMAELQSAETDADAADAGDTTADATPEVPGDDDPSPVDDWDAYMASYKQDLEEIVAPVIPDKTAA